jgi:GcrA cell cycle regulator
MNMEAITAAWTAERIELLKACFEAGLSCREIALEIGFSRNAVIGKIFRLKLSRPGNRRYSERNAGPRIQRRVTQHRIMMALRAEPSQPAEEVPSQNGRCSLLELGEQQCRWPVSQPCDVAFWFCGNTPVAGLPYCPGHARMAYRPASSANRSAMAGIPRSGAPECAKVTPSRLSRATGQSLGAVTIR